MLIRPAAAPRITNDRLAAKCIAASRFVFYGLTRSLPDAGVTGKTVTKLDERRPRPLEMVPTAGRGRHPGRNSIRIVVIDAGGFLLGINPDYPTARSPDFFPFA
jgi:hypothetical protein